MGNEIIKVQKRVAADGTQRGLHRKQKNKAVKLLEDMQADAKEMFGIDGYDPVRALNVIGLQAWHGMPAVDENGNPIIDEDGNPVRVPPDLTLAVAAFAKVAPYVRSQLRPVDPESEDGSNPMIDAKQRAIELAQKLGLPTEGIGDADDD